MNNNDNNNMISLPQWIDVHYDDNSKQTLFLNMDRALKYINDHDYMVDDFSPSKIYVLFNDSQYIWFSSTSPLPDDFYKRDECIKKNIYDSSVLHVKLYYYSKGLGLDLESFLKKFDSSFLIEHLDDFFQFVPSSDIPYYRGVLQRNAGVYLCEFSLEKGKRELVSLGKDVGETINTDNFQQESLTNDFINEYIYYYLSKQKKNAAFSYFLIIPTIIFFVALIVEIVLFIISFAS